MPKGRNDSQCGCQKELQSIAERSMKLAISLPDDVTCKERYTASEAEFLSALRDIAVGFSFAHTWSEDEIRSRSESLRFADASLAYAFSTVTLLRPKGGQSGSADCLDEFNKAKDKCDADPDAGYTCYFDARIAYYACLAGTIVHGIGGGGTIA
jgi:hypothetical protein